MTTANRILTPETAEQLHGIPADTIRRWLRRRLRHQFDSPKGEPERHWFTEAALLEFCEAEAARCRQPVPPERLVLAKPGQAAARR